MDRLATWVSASRYMFTASSASFTSWCMSDRINVIHIPYQCLKSHQPLSSQPNIPKSHIIKPSPIYVHGNINHIKPLDALKDKYKNPFQVKFIFNKLKIMFTNLCDFNDFKIICKMRI